MFEKERTFKISFVVGMIIASFVMAFLAVVTTWGMIRLIAYFNPKVAIFAICFLALFKLSDWTDALYKWAIWNRLGFWLARKLNKAYQSDEK